MPKKCDAKVFQIRSNFIRRKTNEAVTCVNYLKESKQTHMQTRLITRLIMCLKAGVIPRKCGLKRKEMKSRLTSYNYKKLRPFFA